jgi:DNA-binding transcriptional LysR family regulator
LKVHGLDPAKLRVVAEMDTTEAIKQGIKAGMGLSIISCFALSDEVHAGLLRTVAIRGVTIQRHFSLVRHKARTLSPLAQTFERFLHETSPVSLPSLDTVTHVSC